MAAIDYEQATEEDTAEEETETEEATELDDEFAMHAEEAGFTGEKAKALKLAIERCVALKEAGDYDDMAEMMGEEEAEA